MAWYFIIKFFTFIQYCLLNLSVAWNLIIFNNCEVTDVLAWPRDDFYIMKNVKLLQYEMISTKHQILHSLWMFSVSRQVFVQTFSCCANSSSPCTSFSLSIKRWADIMFVCFYVSMLCCFGYFQKITKWVIVLEIYITQDVISSNLVLIILTLYSSQSAKLLEYAKIAKLSYWKLCNFVVLEVSQILFGMET